MKKRSLFIPPDSPHAPSPAVPAHVRYDLPLVGDKIHPSGNGSSKAVESGLLRLCQEIAGTLLRRRLESGDAISSVRETRQELVNHLPDCDQTRAGWLVELALELLYVKSRGQFKRNALELSALIARAGNHLREVSDN